MTLKAPHLETATISGPAGPLEAALETVAQPSNAVAVVCHPHPVHGGTMRNKVVHTLARTFVSMDVPVVRFNFRGVGASAGEFDEGRGELDDALAVLDWAAARWPGKALWLAGFSFGAWVALRASVKRPIAQLITVAPPVDRFTGDEPDAVPCPWVLVQGDKDELVDAESVVAWARALTRPPELILLPGVDHFFHGRLSELKSQLVNVLLHRVPH